MLHLVQIVHPIYGRCVAVVEEDHLIRLNTYRSVYDLAMAAIESGTSLQEKALQDLVTERLKYDPIYAGISDWRFLPPFDHPHDTALCLVAGTGLTHKASAANRQAMHEEEGHTEMTDSMRMFQWGLEGGRPPLGKVGTPPEWFYKGHGDILLGHGEPLLIPPYAQDGGEEPEIAGAYLIAPDGKPHRVGLMAGNEFSDHITEKQNYLYLAPSKLRTCSAGPELIVGATLEDVSGTVGIERKGKTVWSRDIKSGEANMSHTIANLEHHHFKYEMHRRPGDAHVYFYGADAFSFGEGVTLEQDDIMAIHWEGFGRPLRNPLKINESSEELVTVEVM